MSKEQVDRETAAAARKAARTFRRLALEAHARGDIVERDRLTNEFYWHEDLADRLERKYDDEE